MYFYIYIRGPCGPLEALLHMCPHTAILYILCICPHTATVHAARGPCGPFEVLLLHMCPHTAMYMCPHTTVYAAKGPRDPFEALLHKCLHTAMYICLHTTTYVSSYCYICVSAGALLRLGKTIKRQKAHPRGVCSTTALVSALFLILEKKNGSKCWRTRYFFFCYADVC